MLQIDQNRVGGKDQAALTCALCGDERECKHQCERAHEQVSVHGEEGPVFAERGQPRYDPVAGMFAKFAPGEYQPNGNAPVFGNDGGRRDPRDLPVEHNHKQQVENDVDAVGEQHNDQRYARVLQADEPANERIACERCRCAPDANLKVGYCVFPHVRIGTQKIQRKRAERQFECEQSKRDQQRNNHGLAE